MALELNWSKCPNVQELNTDLGRSLSFTAGYVMMFAGIGKVAEETLPELVAWTRLLEMDNKLYYDGKDFAPLPVEMWIDRLGMSSNVGTNNVAKRKTRMLDWMNRMGADEVRITREEMEG